MTMSPSADVTEGRVVEVTDTSELRAQLDATGLVLVEFRKDGCADCRAFDPIYDAFARTAPRDVRLLRVNAEKMLDAALEHQVRAAPTVLLFVNGRETIRLVEPRDAETLHAAVAAYS